MHPNLRFMLWLWAQGSTAPCTARPPGDRPAWLASCPGQPRALRVPTPAPGPPHSPVPACVSPPAQPPGQPGAGWAHPAQQGGRGVPPLCAAPARVQVLVRPCCRRLAALLRPGRAGSPGRGRGLPELPLASVGAGLVLPNPLLTSGSAQGMRACRLAALVRRPWASADATHPPAACAVHPSCSTGAGGAASRRC